MTHSLNLVSYVALLIVMLANLFPGYEDKFQRWRMAVLNLHSLKLTISIWLREKQENEKVNKLCEHVNNVLLSAKFRLFRQNRHYQIINST